MPEIYQYQPLIVNSSTTIASGESLSGTLDLGGTTLVAIQMPALWTAASLSFQASGDGNGFWDLYDVNGNEISINADASRMIQLSPIDFAGVRFLKIRSGISSAAVNQGADRVLTVVSRAL